MQPLVTVICLSYNHEKFLPEALNSVLNQTYPNIEIIVVDDASTDNSAAIIEHFCEKYPEIRFIKHEKNTGNTKAFNEAWRVAKGDFFIDFATDDVMLPERVAEQVQALQNAGKDYGVCYSDAILIDEQSREIGYHYKRDKNGNLLDKAPSGDVFTEVLRRYFINPPTMLFRREVLEKLNGYDEELAYEDFDFWVRSARDFKYIYVDKALTKRRIHPKSLSQKFHQKNNKLAASTAAVCKKAMVLVSTSQEKAVLIQRIKTEIRLAFFTENFEAALLLLNQLKELEGESFFYTIFKKMAKKQLKLSFLRNWYYRIRYKK